MCFSAPASFTASAGLLVIGAFAIIQAKDTPQRFLASIPVIFAVQQFSEGLLWLSLSHAGYANWQNLSMYAFLIFAQVLWPSFVPFTILLFEKNPGRKKIIRFLLAVGVLTSLYLSYGLIFYHAKATIAGHHIKYDLDFPYVNSWFGGLSYLMAALITPFISSLKRLRLLGLILLLSYLITRIFYREYLISVWCYFAAILSLLIVVIIRQLRTLPAVSSEL